MAWDRTDEDHHMRNAKQQLTLSYSATLSIMRILELESRCAVIRTVGSNPTLSANFLALRMFGQRPFANRLQTFRYAGSRHTAFGSKADTAHRSGNVRYVPEADIVGGVNAVRAWPSLCPSLTGLFLFFLFRGFASVWRNLQSSYSFED
jgi:hypothetical protein